MKINNESELQKRSGCYHQIAAAYIFLNVNIVEATGFEPVSKHIRRKPSTCLFCFVLSEINWKQTTDLFLSWIFLSNQHSLWLQHLVLFWVGGGAWKQANRPGGPNDYLITD